MTTLLLILVIAVANLFLGFLVARLFPDWLNAPQPHLAAQPSGVNRMPTVPAALVAECPATVNAVNRPAASSAAVDAQKSPAAGVNRIGPSDTEKAAAGWTATAGPDFRQHLQTIQERIQYARTASDKQLAKDVATQLRTHTQLWLSRVAEHADAASTAVSNTPTGAANSLETSMCLVQFESTLANIEALDWNDDCDSILKCLDHEASVLKRAFGHLHLA